MEKQCTKCGQNKLFTEFGNRGKGSPLKKASCRVCEYAVGKLYLLENKQKRNDTVRKYKLKHAKKIADNRAAYKAANSDILKKKNVEYYKKNISLKAVYSKAYYKINKVKILKGKIAYYLLNPEKLQEKGRKYFLANAEKIAVNEKSYRTEFPEKGRARLMKRRARKLHATPVWFSEFDELVVNEATKLAADRERLTGFKWHVDHVVPLQGKMVCGLHIGINLAVIPASENLRKGNRL